MIIDNITLKVIGLTRVDVNKKTNDPYQIWELAYNGEILNLVFKPKLNPNVSLTPNSIINCSVDLLFKKSIKQLEKGPFAVYSYYGSFYNVIVKHQGIGKIDLYNINPQSQPTYSTPPTPTPTPNYGTHQYQFKQPTPTPTVNVQPQPMDGTANQVVQPNPTAQEVSDDELPDWINDIPQGEI